jgi:hypothetical protein
MVGDASPHPPRRIDPAGEAEGGRGLLLVEALSSKWGWYATSRRETTKVVWAELRESASMSGTPLGDVRVAGGKPWQG